MNTAYPVGRQDRHFYFRLFLLSRKVSNATMKLPKAIIKPIIPINIIIISAAVMYTTSLPMYFGEPVSLAREATTLSWALFHEKTLPQFDRNFNQNELQWGINFMVWLLFTPTVQTITESSLLRVRFQQKAGFFATTTCSYVLCSKCKVLPVNSNTVCSLKPQFMLFTINEHLLKSYLEFCIVLLFHLCSK